ncbi:MAG: P-II family nitrogen regulator [Gemmatimonadetes bacterium]|nr:P-II family nitrogen regulator [Gemmatimonadota bacterium]
MKLIVAIVRPFKLPALVDAMAAEPAFPGITVLPCRGFGREKAAPHVHTADEDLHDFSPGVVLLVAAPDDVAHLVEETITRCAHTGRAGDGKIFILPMEDALRIASGERLDEALR